MRRVLVWSVLLTVLLSTGAAVSSSDRNTKLWYDEPAKHTLKHGVPIGNGSLGGLIHGKTADEHLVLNIDSLWTGNENPSGKYGHDFGAYQKGGDLRIHLPGHKKFSSYHRELDISEAVARVRYKKDGVTYRREYFASYPHKIVAIRLSADTPGSYTGAIEFVDAHGAPAKAAGDRLVCSGKLWNDLKYEVQILARHKGGSLSSAGSKLKFADCDRLTLLLAADTSYVMDEEQGWQGKDPHEKVSRRIEKAADTDYEVLKTSHLTDYRPLFQRVKLELGSPPESRASLPTDERLKEYTLKGGNDPGLEELLFHYGRYLLIASSRRGTLPANLQGIWNNSNSPPWHSDYHTDINIQMNYWPAEPAGLSDSHRALIEFVHSQIPAWREATRAADLFQLDEGPVRGWAVRFSHNIFGGMGWRWHKPGNAWYAHRFWEHYVFTQDREYLEGVCYPVLKELCQFWEDHLKALPDGRLVVPHTWSPEHGPYEDGTSYAQELVWDLFTNYILASQILNRDPGYRRQVAEMREELHLPDIGRWGQLQEWMVDRDKKDDHHRHVSHLFALHPGRQISPLTTPKMARAAQVSLEARGDKGTGWSRAWKINLWARLLDGNHAHRLLRNLLTLVGKVGVDYSGSGGGVYANLFDVHPPFQIDGNFGATAGMCEMLLQSHLRATDTGMKPGPFVIHLLPALPDAWPTGSVRGLRARGDFRVNMEWRDGKLVHVSIHSGHGNACRVAYDDRIISLDTEAGKTYQVTPETFQDGKPLREVSRTWWPHFATK